jgi:outer membrane usher protein
MCNAKDNFMKSGDYLSLLRISIFFIVLFCFSSVRAEEIPYALNIYALKVNGQDMGVGPILLGKSAGYLARAEDFEAWGLNQANSAPVKFMNEDYYPLAEVKGYKFTLDEVEQALTLEFDPAAFKPTVLSALTETVLPGPAEKGGFANYDFYGTHYSAAQSTQTQLNGQLELGAFNQWGAGVSSFNGQNLYMSPAIPNAQTQVTRLETYWLKDFPQDKQTIRFGDSNGRSGVWGRPVKFGGVQLGTNFATQPGFVTIPQPTFTGEAVLPSTTDVYINGMRQRSLPVTPGLFQLNNIPMITGSGEVKMVVKDMLGREQVITQPFYITPALLRPGLDDYTVELGFIRNNYGLENATYGRPMAVLTQRRGLSDKLTMELRAEALPDQKTAGIAVTYIPPVPLALTIATALSSSSSGSGDFLLLGIEHQTFKGINFGLRSQFTSDHFTQIGAGLPGQARQYSASMGFTTGMGTFGINYTSLKNANLLRSEYISANYSKTIGRKMSVNVSLSSAMVGPSNTMLNVYLNYPFDNGLLVSSNATTQQGHTTGTLQLMKTPPGIGVGYRALVGGQQGAVQREEAGLTLQNDYGMYMFDAGRAPGQTSYRMSASGGLAMMGGHAYLSRHIYDGFAIAQVPGYTGVPVYLNGQLAAHTDNEGYAFLYGLPSYQKSKIRINTDEMPMEAQIENAEVEVVPRYRSGVSLKFSVEISTGALIKLVAENGEPLPNGTVLVVEGKTDEFQVALDGEVYVTGLDKSNRLNATWYGQHCQIDVVLPDNPGPQPHIGPLICKGIQP